MFVVLLFLSATSGGDTLIEPITYFLFHPPGVTWCQSDRRGKFATPDHLVDEGLGEAGAFKHGGNADNLRRLLVCLHRVYPKFDGVCRILKTDADILHGGVFLRRA
ncbi:hypothetical protein [Paraburkholderia strydomiana]